MPLHRVWAPESEPAGVHHHATVGALGDGGEQVPPAHGRRQQARAEGPFQRGLGDLQPRPTFGHGRRVDRSRDPSVL